jgi:hypothetical protein
MRVLKIHHPLGHKWIRAASEKLPDPAIPEDAREIEFDETWHFVGSKKQNLAH